MKSASGKQRAHLHVITIPEAQTNPLQYMHLKKKKKEENQNSGELSPQDCFTAIRQSSAHQSRALSFDIIYHMGLCSAT